MTVFFDDRLGYEKTIASQIKAFGSMVLVNRHDVVQIPHIHTFIYLVCLPRICFYCFFVFAYIQTLGDRLCRHLGTVQPITWLFRLVEWFRSTKEKIQRVGWEGSRISLRHSSDSLGNKFPNTEVGRFYQCAFLQYSIRYGGLWSRHFDCNIPFVMGVVITSFWLGMRG